MLRGHFEPRMKRNRACGLVMLPACAAALSRLQQLGRVLSFFIYIMKGLTKCMNFGIIYGYSHIRTYKNENI